MGLTASAFMVTGLVSRFSLTSHSDSGSFLVAHASLSQNGCQREGFWAAGRHGASPVDLSRALPGGGGSLVPCSLPGPLSRADGYCGAGQHGRFRSCASRNRSRLCSCAPSAELFRGRKEFRLKLIECILKVRTPLTSVS